MFSTPIPRFNGLSVCWNFNKTGCTRPAHSANACKDTNTNSIFAHVCNFWDPVAKQHCYGAHRLSALELVGPLVCVAAGAHLCRGQPVNIWVDNAGSVQIWKKGYATTCQLSSCLVRAIACVADALDCRVELVKVRRCSDTGPELADLLSKGLFCKFAEHAAEAGWPLLPLPAAVPPSIIRWVANPTADDQLGQKILRDLAESMPVINMNC